MAPLLSRILVSVLVLPAGALLYTIVFVVGYELGSYPYRGRTAWIAAGVATWVFVTGCWLLLWRKYVRWTAYRSRLTLLAAGASAILGGAVGYLLRGIADDFAFFTFSSLSPLIWLFLMVLIWKELPSERSSRLTNAKGMIICPACGYDLRGLHEARCPECGSRFTLDELVARQPSRDLEVLESPALNLGARTPRRADAISRQ